MLIDARTVERGAQLDFDLAVVGSGFAGIALVDRLRRSGISIALLESGGLDPELRTQRLYRGESVGEPYFRLDACRYRLFGGSSNRWGGACRPLDPVDYEARDWIAHSGWPISHSDVEPYHADAARALDLETPDFTREGWDGRLPPLLSLVGDEFEHAVFQRSRSNFADQYGQGILAAGNVTTLLHANVTALNLDHDGRRIESVQVKTLTGRSFNVRARMVVLAAGGIENARLLLASRHQRSAGIGNEHDQVGRYFMEHLHVAAGHFVSNGRPVPTDFYRWGVPSYEVRGSLTPSTGALARLRLPSCGIAFEHWSHAVHGMPLLGWSPWITTGPVTAYRRLVRANPAAADRVTSGARVVWRVGRTAWGRRTERDVEARQLATANGKQPDASLYVRAEQTPNPRSRISLTARLDELGVPLVRLDWRVAEADRAAIISWIGRLGSAMREAGLGDVVTAPEGWEAGVIGGPHHIGTTRMSEDPRAGVVDRNCRVHSVENLYVAGSSVFTTGGYANPTFTLVALSLRLADHLAKRSAAERSGQ